MRLALSGTKAEHSVTFVKRVEAEWIDAGSCVLYDAGRCRRCTRQTAKRGEATEYRAVDADGRTLLGYSISASGAATPMAAGGYLPAADCAGASPMPAYAADSHASPQMVALNVCSVSESGDISEPRVVYLIDGERFDERFVSVTVTEGWLSPAVWPRRAATGAGAFVGLPRGDSGRRNTAGIRPLTATARRSTCSTARRAQALGR